MMRQHELPPPSHPFGDPFALDMPSLPRPASGYAVQLLGTDRILDRSSMQFLAVRDRALQGSFATFAEAEQAARAMAAAVTDPETLPMGIVPVGYDSMMQRHVLIHGVLRAEP